MSDNNVDKTEDFLFSYKGLVTGLALTVLSITGIALTHTPNDSLVERVKKIDQYYEDYHGYIPGRYGMNMNALIHKNTEDLIDSLEERNRLVSIPGYESRERVYNHSERISDMIYLGSTMSGSVGIYFLLPCGLYSLHNIVVKLVQKHKKNKSEKNKK